MCRFAYECRERMNELTRELELSLGPGTSDLALRIGLHSGPVTGGVLRGEKGRFQLFGDTVNTAARMESNGRPNSIHCSQKTADRLFAAGKIAWLTKRDELVAAKGKGMMQTYWVEPKKGSGTYSSGDFTDTSGSWDEPTEGEGLDLDSAFQISGKYDRLVEWSVGTFEDILRKVVAHRVASGEVGSTKVPVKWKGPVPGTTARDEVSLAIPLPVADYDGASGFDVELPVAVSRQLRDFLSVVAHSSSASPFHNFQHACHVAMSLKQTMQHITSTNKAKTNEDQSLAFVLDPLGQAAIFFSGLVHVMGHPGVSNGQLVKEGNSLASFYNNKSIVEQNALDCAWKLLFEPAYETLRSYLFTSQEDIARFRQYVVNAIMATDISDPELNIMRDQHWNASLIESAEASVKATNVYELVIQASDASHAMQDWAIYEKWARLLLEEEYAAYSVGRGDQDPLECFYEDQLSYFDNHVLPLTLKLKQNRMHGSSSDEFYER